MDGSEVMSVAGVPKAGKAEATVRETLQGLDRHNGQLNAVAARFDDAALADAGHRDQLAAQEASLGPLHGLPFVVKDIIDLAGVPTRSGSLTRAQNPSAAQFASAPVLRSRWTRCRRRRRRVLRRGPHLQ